MRRSNDFAATWTQARQARAAGIEMVAVGVGNNLNQLELETIASADNVLRATGGFSALSDTVDAALEAICNSKCAWFIPLAGQVSLSARHQY